MHFAASDGLLFGSYRGKNQSRLSKTVRPPAKFPYASPAILWLVGFFQSAGRFSALHCSRARKCLTIRLVIYIM